MHIDCEAPWKQKSFPLNLCGIFHSPLPMKTFIRKKMFFIPCFVESETHNLFGQALTGYLFYARQANARCSRGEILVLLWEAHSSKQGESDLRVWQVDVRRLRFSSKEADRGLAPCRNKCEPGLPNFLVLGFSELHFLLGEMRTSGLWSKIVHPKSLVHLAGETRRRLSCHYFSEGLGRGSALRTSHD